MNAQNTELLITFIQISILNSIPAENRTKEVVMKQIEKFYSATHIIVDDPEPLTEAQKSYIENKIFDNMYLAVPEGQTIINRKSNFKHWLNDRRADIKFFYWDRYKAFLLQKKAWPQGVVTTLDKDSDKILDLLGNPKDTSSWIRYGLMIGDVQSGKTANYTAIINKAADAGYQVIIVLTGTTENLRRQTQERLEKEFVGTPSKVTGDLKMQINWNPIGVGEGSSGKRSPICFTSTQYDFQSAGANQVTQKLNDEDTYLFVLKKNKTVLNNLFDWLSKNNPKVGGVYNLSALIIDDESDNASVNTNKSETNPTAINAGIRNILSAFARASYLAVTATPYANIFIDGNVEDEQQRADLFPKDYIHLLEASPEYIGATALFSETASFQAKNCIKALNIEDIEAKIPMSHKKDQLSIDSIDDLPQSLLESLRYFLLVQALMDYVPGLSVHRSMLINVSRFTDVQIAIRDTIDNWLRNAVHPSVKNYHGMPDWASSPETGEIYYLKKIWTKYNLAAISGISWEDFSVDKLWTSIAKVSVVSINQKSEPLVYEEYPHGLRVIAVGGFSLSRGLTLEGLVVSYFYRNSKAYDTLMQMGRWFGYRSAYLDYFKIWMSADSILWYRTIVEATQNLKNQILRMIRLGSSPAEFGLAIQRQPLSRLLITARNKMQNTVEGATLPVIISGNLIETPRLYNNPEINKKNGILLKKFVTEVSNLGIKVTDQKDICTKSAILWQGIPKEKISDLVQQFQSHRWNLNYQAEALSKYILEDNDNQKWDVAIVSKEQGKDMGIELYSETDPKLKVYRQRRTATIFPDENLIKIGKKSVRVGPGQITQIGLTKEKIEEIRGTWKINNPNSTNNPPDTRFLSVERTPLLLIYSLVVEMVDKDGNQAPIWNGETVYAIGLGFPLLENESPGKCVQYIYNPVAARSFLGIDENMMDSSEEDDE